MKLKKKTKITSVIFQINNVYCLKINNIILVLINVILHLLLPVFNIIFRSESQ
jgi:hypothetical protein